MPRSVPPRRSSRRAQLFWGCLALAACVAGGALECQRPARSPVEEHGRELYTKMCVVCHGPSGEGYKADQAPAIGHPDLLGAVSDNFLRSAINFGRTGTTMSAWSMIRGGPLKIADTDALISYLRTWGPRERTRLDERPLHGDEARGSAIFARECVRCHGDKGVGGPNVHIGSRDFLANVTNGYLRLVIANGRAPTAMPAFGPSLGAAGVEDVATYVRGLTKTAPHAPTPVPSRPPPIPLGPVPLNPKGPEPAGFLLYPKSTPAAVIKSELDRHAKMSILDARAPSDYTNSHIAGAVSVPFYDPSPYYDKLPKDSWMVCYCSCPHAESGMLADALQKHGFKKVTVIAEGLPTWTARKYGVNHGTAP